MEAKGLHTLRFGWASEVKCIVHGIFSVFLIWCTLFSCGAFQGLARSVGVRARRFHPALTTASLSAHVGDSPLMPTFYGFTSDMTKLLVYIYIVCPLSNCQPFS